MFPLVVEYDGFVVLAEASGHRRFATDPQGSALRGIHDAAVRAIAGTTADQVAEERAKIEAAKARRLRIREAVQRAKDSRGKK